MGFVRAVAAAAALAGAGGGCARSYPNAVSFNQDLPEEATDGVPGRADQQLTPRQQDEALAAMRSVAAGHTVVDRPAPAPRGVRWSEIPRAVAWACGRAGVEMVVVATEQDPDEYRFDLLTIENWPGQLVIARGTGGSVYRVVSAQVGRFPDAPENAERAKLLVSKFEQRLKVLGARRQFNDPDH